MYLVGQVTFSDRRYLQKIVAEVSSRRTRTYATAELLFGSST
jgi:hypothetical protein